MLSVVKIQSYLANIKAILNIYRFVTNVPDVAPPDLTEKFQPNAIKKRVDSEEWLVRLLSTQQVLLKL